MEARKDQYEAYVKSVTPVHSTWKNVLMAGISGGLICLAAQISTNCLVQTGMEEKVALDDAGTDSAQRYPDRGKCIPEAGSCFWSWCAGSDHRIRQFSCIPGAGIQGGRTGVWCRMQNIYNRGSGDPVWDSEFVGIRGCVLGVDDADSIINEKKSQ
mgnify:CR=1 FL=1